MKRDMRSSLGSALSPTLLALGAFLGVFTLLAPEAQAARPCCSITAIDTRTGIVNARVKATGQEFQFHVRNPVLLQGLRVGQDVYANLRAQQVSLDGSRACCRITMVAATKDEKQPAEIAPLQSAGAGASSSPKTTKSGPGQVVKVDTRRDLEGVSIDGNRATIKAGYRFERTSSSSGRIRGHGIQRRDGVYETFYKLACACVNEDGASAAEGSCELTDEADTTGSSLSCLRDSQTPCKHSCFIAFTTDDRPPYEMESPTEQQQRPSTGVQKKKKIGPGIIDDGTY